MIWVQLVAVGLAALACLAWALNFPYPSPLIRRFLPPRARWPEAQVRGWIGRGRVRADFLRHFNRDPERHAPPGDGWLAPADGLVVSADVREGVRYLRIALSFWDMHVQRSPLAGTVRAVERLGSEYMDREGADFAFLREKACPVQARIVLDTARGPIAVCLITSFSARRIETFVAPGDAVARGQRIGRIRLGSTVVLELPADVPLQVACRERVRAGETVVAGALP